MKTPSAISICFILWVFEQSNLPFTEALFAPIECTKNNIRVSFVHLNSPSLRRPRPISASSVDNTSTIPLEQHFTSPLTVEWVQKILDSYFVELGTELIPNRSELSHKEQAELIATSSLAIASHDFLRFPDDATFIYGNIFFLEAFGFPWNEFVELPSRKCVATVDDVAERQVILDKVKNKKVDSGKTDYENLVRVRKDGDKIILNGVTLWNVYENAKAVSETRVSKIIGQAVTVERVTNFHDMS
mmetsp:Transcript_32823/g.75539  ORF Transcript_32823/g.75539 Transcript_32823/m.75539 type:complete len:245 (-) Transcript_32823:56-790(-)